MSSVSAKKNRASRSAFSSESDAWMAFRSLDSAKSFRTVPRLRLGRVSRTNGLPERCDSVVALQKPKACRDQRS